MSRSMKPLGAGIFIMMKYPEVGKVKSRLARSIGNDFATGFYRACIHDTLTTVQSLSIAYHIAVSPPEALEQSIDWLGSAHRYFQQHGSNLGERLQDGFARLFEEGFQQVIALASDCPDLPAEILQTAASTLDNQEVVLGPAPDGGYYLIGFSERKSLENTFEDISWGTETVFQETLAKLGTDPNRVHVLPEWPDIDTLKDLQAFYRRHETNPSQTLQTMKFLHSHPELLDMLLS